MTWRPAPRTPAATAAHEAAEADRRARPERYRLDPDRIAEVAARGADADRFAPGWRTGLEQYLGSAREDGRLTALGLGMVAATAIGRLRAGAALDALRSAEPDRFARPLAPPIVIVGGWRTGTTFLFRLLATDPRLRAPLPAELTDPAAVAGMDPARRERFLDAAGAAHELLHTLNPGLRAVHDSGARLPEECVLGMGTDLRSWGFPSTVRLDGYARWMAGEDLGPGYARHRHLLQALDAGDGRRWVLKAPAHTAELPHLVAAFPGATVVHLHRDIVATVASGASLFAVFRSTYSDEVDAADVGRFQADQTELWLRRAHAFRSDPASTGATFVDLAYEDLVADPGAALAVVCAAAGLDPPADPDALVAAFHRDQPRHGHGTHRYTAADFGLDEGELRERFAFLADGPGMAR
ncbi:MAG TPA: sulfotransferase [Iamia sp.]|nr:sulfotransferase [Iamia sp.]